MPVRHYHSEDDDSARWQHFPFRDGDVVVSTRSKHGTTWMQMILLLLIHQRPDLPAPLPELSPWLDHLVEPLDDVITRLESQDHRRVVKTHTPLDGIPLDPRATYVVVGRNPLDAAVSFYPHVQNIDRVRQAELLGTPVETPPPPPVEEWLPRWIAKSTDPLEPAESLDKVMWHLGDAWKRRDRGDVVTVHYADLRADLAGEMRRLADRLGITVPDPLWDDLVAAATLEAMRAKADELAPDPVGVLSDKRAFFRSGGLGAGAALLDDQSLQQYRQRLAELAPPDLVAWVDR